MANVYIVPTVQSAIFPLVLQGRARLRLTALLRPLNNDRSHRTVR